MRQFFDQIVQLLQQGIAAIFRLIRMALEYVSGQIQTVPWGNFGSLPYWKQALLIAALIFAIYYLFTAIMSVLRASEGLLGAFVTVLQAIVRLIVPLIIAGFAIVVAIWIVNRVDLPFLP